MVATIDEKKVMEVLGKLQDPELHMPLMKLNMIRDICIDDAGVSFTVMLTTPACPLKSQIEGDAKKALMAVAGVGQVNIKFGAETLRAMPSGPSQTPAASGATLIPEVKNVIAVGSGKGGVGKSTVAVNLAVALAKLGAKVGLLDADIYGPSVPLLTSVKACTLESDGKTMIPAFNYGVKIISMGFFIKDSDPVIWRGPMLHGIIQKFLGEVRWGELDYLVIDLPPGTGDVQLSLSQMIPISAAVVVTTPQDVALLDVRRAVYMFKKVRVEVAGVIENMSAFECPHCHEETKIFGEGAGEKIHQEFQVPLLGRIALTKSLMESGEKGTPIVASDPESVTAKSFIATAQQLAGAVSVLNFRRPKVEIV